MNSRRPFNSAGGLGGTVSTPTGPGPRPGVRFFLKNVLNIGLNKQDVWKAKNRYILNLRMEQDDADSYSQYMQ